MFIKEDQLGNWKFFVVLGGSVYIGFLVYFFLGYRSYVQNRIFGKYQGVLCFFFKKKVLESQLELSLQVWDIILLECYLKVVYVSLLFVIISYLALSCYKYFCVKV